MVAVYKLPLELVVKTLKGGHLEDLVNVMHTSSFFRSIGESSRSLWKDAPNAHTIPLPMGETLDTVPPRLLTELAARATSLSRTWDTGTARPRRFYDISVPGYSRLDGPNGFYRFPSLSASFLPGAQWILLLIDKKPNLYCLESGAHLSLDVAGDISSYAYDSSNNGADVVIAVLVVINRGPGIEFERFIEIFVLKFDRTTHFQDAPSVTRAPSIHIPTYSLVQHVELQGSLVVASGGAHVFISNWRDVTGVYLAPTSNVGMKARFHPSLPLLIAERHANRGYSIHAIELPPKLEPLTEFEMGEEEHTWPIEQLGSTCLHELELELKLDHVPRYTSFRGRTREQPVLDVVSGPKSGPPRTLSHLSVSGFDGPPTTRTRPVSWEGGKTLLEVHTASGRSACMGQHQIYEEGTAHVLSFLRMPDGTREEASWVSLVLPEGLGLRGMRDEVLAFDDVYGALLLNCGPGKLCVVNY